MTDQHAPQGDDEGKDDALHTGVIDTGGSGLHHAEDVPADSGDQPTPVDVNLASPLDTPDTAGVSDDGGSGIDPLRSRA